MNFNDDRQRSETNDPLLRRILLIGLLVIVGLVWWRGLPTQVESEIATVVPRGNLAEDEKATIELFATAAPAVVHKRVSMARM
jgi:hypothetical protein